MTIHCKFCNKFHNIKPLLDQENTLMRAMLYGDLCKSYFCDLLCFYRLNQRWHPDGYYPKTATQVIYDHNLQTDPNHAHWKAIPWLEESYKKAVTGNLSPSTLIILDREEKIVNDAIEQARIENETSVDAYDDGGDADGHEWTQDDCAPIQGSRRTIEA